MLRRSGTMGFGQGTDYYTTDEKRILQWYPLVRAYEVKILVAKLFPRNSVDS